MKKRKETKYAEIEKKKNAKDFYFLDVHTYSYVQYMENPLKVFAEDYIFLVYMVIRILMTLQCFLF